MVEMVGLGSALEVNAISCRPSEMEARCKGHESSVEGFLVQGARLMNHVLQVPTHSDFPSVISVLNNGSRLKLPRTDNFVPLRGSIRGQVEISKVQDVRTWTFMAGAWTGNRVVEAHGWRRQGMRIGDEGIGLFGTSEKDRDSMKLTKK